LIGAADLARHAVLDPPMADRGGFWPGHRPRLRLRGRRRLRRRADAGEEAD
jgi:hypothetical protein